MSGSAKDETSGVVTSFVLSKALELVLAVVTDAAVYEDEGAIKLDYFFFIFSRSALRFLAANSFCFCFALSLSTAPAASPCFIDLEASCLPSGDVLYLWISPVKWRTISANFSSLQASTEKAVLSKSAGNTSLIIVRQSACSSVKF